MIKILSLWYSRVVLRFVKENEKNIYSEIWSVLLWNWKEISHTLCSMKHVIIITYCRTILELNLETSSYEVHWGGGTLYWKIKPIKFSIVSNLSFFLEIPRTFWYPSYIETFSDFEIKGIYDVVTYYYLYLILAWWT